MTPKRRLLVRGGLLLGAVGGAAVGLLVVGLFPPTDSSFYPKCMSHQLFGIHCPGCGSTRGLHALLNGRLEQAVAYNVLLVVFLPWVALFAVRTAWHWLWGSHPPAGRPRPVLTWTVIAVCVLYGMLRNVPAYPFTLLAPHELSR